MCERSDNLNAPILNSHEYNRSEWQPISLTLVEYPRGRTNISDDRFLSLNIQIKRN